MSASLRRLAMHEARLGWRDLAWMLTTGKRRRAVRVAIGFAIFVLFLHGLSYLVLTHGVTLRAATDTQTLVSVTASLLIAWMLMLSQAMESITRVFYTRGDLELILASPVRAARVFALRVGINAVLISFMSVLLIAPVVNVLAIIDRPAWLAGYGVALAMGLSATALAILLTIGLFHLAGPRRTRLIAQVIAAVMGAIFVIGIQLVGILQTGSLSRSAVLHLPALLAHAPAAPSAIWLPARAVMGDGMALLAVLGAAALLFAAITAATVGRFAQYSIAAVSVTRHASAAHRKLAFHAWSPQRALRRKELKLITRDPWLVSQTLMQLLYLLPPALLLWKDLTSGGQGILVIVPVLVMAAGQLAGGLTWITISGEDARDLIRTAPVAPRAVRQAKLQAVLLAIAGVFAPLLALLGLESLTIAGIGMVGILAATCSSVLIQFWFRTESRRSAFRRRHTASRIATFAEAFCCVGWAGTAAMAAAHSWFALVPALFALLILSAARLFRTARD